MISAFVLLICLVRAVSGSCQVFPTTAKHLQGAVIGLTWPPLFLPSKLKGYVTTPTVRMPLSLESCATTGAAPVPVPPPIPAVMNTCMKAITAATDMLELSHEVWSNVPF